MATPTHPAEPKQGFDFHDDDPASHVDGHHETGTMLCFWIYLMSDSLIFGILFAVYAVLGQNYAAGPAPSDLFEIEKILLATFFLLFSSITYGFAVINMQEGKQGGMVKWLIVTGAFGLGFLVMELLEFHHLWHLGAGPGASRFCHSFGSLPAPTACTSQQTSSGWWCCWCRSRNTA